MSVIEGMHFKYLCAGTISNCFYPNMTEEITRLTHNLKILYRNLDIENANLDIENVAS